MHDLLLLVRLEFSPGWLPQTGQGASYWHLRTLQVGDRPTQSALALAEFGRIEKTLHALNYIDDENRR